MELERKERAEARAGEDRRGGKGLRTEGAGEPANKQLAGKQLDSPSQPPWLPPWRRPPVRSAQSAFAYILSQPRRVNKGLSGREEWGSLGSCPGSLGLLEGFHPPGVAPFSLGALETHAGSLTIPHFLLVFTSSWCLLAFLLPRSVLTLKPADRVNI